jgi:hypothetical protein
MLSIARCSLNEPLRGTSLFYFILFIRFVYSESVTDMMSASYSLAHKQLSFTLLEDPSLTVELAVTVEWEQYSVHRMNNTVTDMDVGGGDLALGADALKKEAGRVKINKIK